MIIQSKRIWIDNEFKEAQIEIEDGKIVNIHPYNSKAVDNDYGEYRIVPGFIDIHTHGAYGFDTNDGIEEGLRNWIKRIPEEGVTSILPTTVTMFKDVLENALRNVAKVVNDGYDGAEILGVHFEGPYLDLEYKGAQPKEAIVVPNIEEFKHYQECANGLIKYVTLAPEHDENHELIKYLSSNGVVVSMGHSSATYEEGVSAIKDGVKSMTHVYNGMTPLHHRKPGLVGVALNNNDVYGEIIADGHHSHLAALSIFFKLKNNKAIMITDSLRPKGCPKDGYYTLGSHVIEIDDEGLAKIKGTNTIAGSTLRMNKGLKLLVEQVKIPFDIALNSCTINPAKCLNVDHYKGLIKESYDADLVVLDDEYNVIQTYCKGKNSL